MYLLTKDAQRDYQRERELMDRPAPSHRLHVRWGLISIEVKICVLEEQQCLSASRRTYSDMCLQNHSSVFLDFKLFSRIMHHNENVADILIN